MPYEKPTTTMYWDGKCWIVRLTLKRDHSVNIPYDTWVGLSATQQAIENAIEHRFREKSIENWDGLESGPTVF